MTVKSMRHQWLAMLLIASTLFAGCAGISLQDQIDALMKEGQQLYSASKYDDAVFKFAEVIAKDPKYWLAYVWIARALIAKGNWTDAIGNARKAYELGPRSADVIPVFAEALFGGGVQALSRGDFRTAIGLLREYVKFDPNNLSAYLNLAKAYWESGERGSAIDAFRKVLELNPRNEDALRFLLQR